MVANKVHFTNSTADLEKFIEPSQILTELGGPNGWTYDYVEPDPRENKMMEDTETRDELVAQRHGLRDRYEDVVREEWMRLKEEETAQWEEVRKRRNGLAAELSRNYWKLDPYVRARSVYDRYGDIKNPET